MSPEILAGLRFAGPVLLSALLCALVVRSGIRDAPDGGRKTQKTAVPNSGGVAILLTTALAAWLAAQAGLLSNAWLDNGAGTILAAALVAGVIGLVDDIAGMSARLKLFLMVIVSVTLAWLGPQLTLPGMPAFVATAGVALWLLITMNAVNFMDGSNGLAMGASAIMLVGAANLVGGSGPASDTAHIAVTASLAILGFLAWNLPGRLYAGDSGSLGIGALFGGASIVVAQATTVWTAAILFLPFLVDVMLTILWRARSGRSVMTAHREHAYQLMIRGGWAHLPVAAIWWSFSGICWFAAARAPAHLAIWVFLGLAAAGSVLWFGQRLTLGRHLEADGR